MGGSFKQLKKPPIQPQSELKPSLSKVSLRPIEKSSHSPARPKPDDKAKLFSKSSIKHKRSETILPILGKNFLAYG